MQLFYMVYTASGIDRGHVRPTTTAKNDDLEQRGDHTPANTESCSAAVLVHSVHL